MAMRTFAAATMRANRRVLRCGTGAYAENMAVWTCLHGHHCNGALCAALDASLPTNQQSRFCCAHIARILTLISLSPSAYYVDTTAP
jgi:hypothetical protein